MRYRRVLRGECDPELTEIADLVSPNPLEREERALSSPGAP
jgi:hypothetical protein